jgi:transposase
MVSEACTRDKSLHHKVIRHTRRGQMYSASTCDKEMIMTTTPVLGIDIAKAKFDVALGVGQRPRRATFDNNVSGFVALEQWLRKQGAMPAHACMEATGRYGEALAEALYENGHIVSVVNPARIKKYADSQLSRNKTDVQDALVILDFAQTQKIEPWQPPEADQRKLQEMVRYHDSLKTMRRQESNRLSSGLKSAEVINPIQQHLAYLDRQIELLEAEMQGLLEQNQQLRKRRDLLTTIPGIGKLTATRLLAEIADVTAFDNAKQLAAYAGLTPSHHQSGSSVRRRTHLSKMGRSSLRKHLYMPALAAYRYNPAIKALRQRLLAKGKHKMAIVGAAMRKLLHIVYGVLKSGRPFDPAVCQAA